MVFLVGGKYQGKLDFAKSQFADFHIIPEYEEIVRRQIAQGKDPFAEAESLLSGDSCPESLLIISEETGCGIVPLSREDRDFQEQNGRVNCFFAARAEKVYRILCGIPQRIK